MTKLAIAVLMSISPPVTAPQLVPLVPRESEGPRVQSLFPKGIKGYDLPIVIGGSGSRLGRSRQGFRYRGWRVRCRNCLCLCRFRASVHLFLDHFELQGELRCRIEKALDRAEGHDQLLRNVVEG